MPKALAPHVTDTHLRLPLPEYKALKAEADRQERSVSWLIRRIVKDWLEKKV